MIKAQRYKEKRRMSHRERRGRERNEERTKAVCLSARITWNRFDKLKKCLSNDEKV